MALIVIKNDLSWDFSQINIEDAILRDNIVNYEELDNKSGDISAGHIKFDRTVRPIEDILTELASEVPLENWEHLPSDLTDNLDYYIYGINKK